MVYIDIYAQIKRIHAESQNLLWGSESPRELRCEALRCQLALPALGIQHVECVGIGRIDFHAPVSEFFSAHPENYDKVQEILKGLGKLR